MPRCARPNWFSQCFPKRGLGVPALGNEVLTPEAWSIWASLKTCGPAERAALQEGWQVSSSSRVVLSGDLHSTWALDVPGSTKGPPLAAELLAPSISSGWPEELDQPIRTSLERNPHVRHYRAERGYLLHRVSPKLWTTTARTVDATLVAARVGRGLTCTIEAGRPGLADVAEPTP